MVCVKRAQSLKTDDDWLGVGGGGPVHAEGRPANDVCRTRTFQVLAQLCRLFHPARRSAVRLEIRVSASLFMCPNVRLQGSVPRVGRAGGDETDFIGP